LEPEGGEMSSTTRILVANAPKLMREVVLATLTDHADIEVVGEVSAESEILPRMRLTRPDVVVIALDGTGARPAICDQVLREFPEVRIIAVASRKDRSIFYWASFDIHANDIDASAQGFLSAVRSASDLARKPL
jgi:DNA-binding NarL/FixJ family response regulator